MPDGEMRGEPTRADRPSAEGKTSPEVPSAKAVEATEAELESRELLESRTEEEPADEAAETAVEPSPERADERARLFELDRQLNEAVHWEGAAERGNEGRVSGALEAYDQARAMLGDTLQQSEPSRMTLLQLQGIAEKAARMAELGAAFDWPMEEGDRERVGEVVKGAEEVRQAIEDRLEDIEGIRAEAARKQIAEAPTRIAERPAAAGEPTKVVEGPPADEGPTMASAELLESEPEGSAGETETGAENEPGRELEDLTREWIGIQDRYRNIADLKGLDRFDKLRDLLVATEQLQDQVVDAEHKQLFPEDQRPLRDLDLELTRFLMQTRREREALAETIDLPDATEAAESIEDAPEESQDDIFSDLEAGAPAHESQGTEEETEDVFAEPPPEQTKVVEAPPAP